MERTTMTITQPKTNAKLITADELLRMYAKGFRGELIRGELCETMPAGGEHGEIIANLVYELQRFVRPARLGRIAASDSGVLLQQNPDTVREPDIAYFSTDRIPEGERVTGYYEVVPDLVVEVASPGNTNHEIHDKARMWLSYGSRVVWVIYPNTRTIAIHPHDGEITLLSDTDTLDGQDILPGFTCNIADIFD